MMPRKSLRLGIFSLTACAASLLSFEPPTDLWVQINQPIGNAITTIPQGTIAWYPFLVDMVRMRSVHLVGRFVAHGGPGNDIQVFVTDADGLENLKNGHRANVFYSTDKVTVGTLDVPLNSTGQYYLVFNNKFSLLSKKYVESQVNLRFEWQKYEGLR